MGQVSFIVKKELDRNITSALCGACSYWPGYSQDPLAASELTLRCFFLSNPFCHRMTFHLTLTQYSLQLLEAPASQQSILFSQPWLIHWLWRKP
jgi:hypothetical protein